MSNSAGKGDKPRNCFSKQFKDNYDQIEWRSWGAVVGEEIRQKMNKASKKTREKYLKEAIKIIYETRK